MKKILLALSILYSSNLFAFCINNELKYDIKWMWQDAPAFSKDGGKVKPGETFCRVDNKKDADHARIILFIPHGIRDVFSFGREFEYVCPNLVINPKTADIHVKTDGLSYFCSLTPHTL